MSEEVEHIRGHSDGTGWWLLATLALGLLLAFLLSSTHRQVPKPARSADAVGAPTPERARPRPHVAHAIAPRPSTTTSARAAASTLSTGQRSVDAPPATGSASAAESR